MAEDHRKARREALVIGEPALPVALQAVRHGQESFSFLAVESCMRHWSDQAPREGTGAVVAYVDTGGAWVAAASPLLETTPDRYQAEISCAMLHFVEAARSHGRRACFFGSEAHGDDRLARLLIGEQPLFRPREWLAGLPRRRSLREQLRRARAKGLTVRRVQAEELAEGSSLRARIERLADDWLRTRHIEPMGFVVALELFCGASEHRYFLAERAGQPVGFLSAVPIGKRRAWLIEDIVRSDHAPNGTTESLIVAMMREAECSEYVTLGLTPLSGAVKWPLRVARWISRPLFDFQGLRAFRERLRPHSWEPVWLVYPRRESPFRAVIDSLHAFARGSPLTFGVRSIFRHPSGLPWSLALPLPLWTTCLAWLAMTHRAFLLGFPLGELGLWVAFDALLLLVLVRVAQRPLRARLLLATSLASIDALLSLGHLAWVGFGVTGLEVALRTLAAAAPVVGAILLAWATTRTVARPSAAT